MQDIEKNQSQRLQDCLKFSGYLEKQNSTAIKSYKKRFFYFFLHDNQISLLYKDQESDQKTIGQIQLSQVTDVKYNQEKKKKIQIVSQDRKYKFRCQTRIDAIQWWENIKFLLNYQQFILAKKIDKANLSSNDYDSPIKIIGQNQKSSNSSSQKIGRQNSLLSGASSSKKSGSKKISEQTLKALNLQNQLKQSSENNLLLYKQQSFSKQNTQNDHFEIDLKQNRNSENLTENKSQNRNQNQNFQNQTQNFQNQNQERDILIQQISSDTFNSYEEQNNKVNSINNKKNVLELDSQNSLERGVSSKSSAFDEIIDIQGISLDQQIQKQSNFVKNQKLNLNQQNNTDQRTQQNSSQIEVLQTKDKQIQKQQIKIDEQQENIKNLEKIIDKLEKENMKLQDLYEKNKINQKNQNESLQKDYQNQELQEQNQKLKDLILNQKQQIGELEVHNKQLIKQKDEHNQEIKGLKQDLYKLEEAKDYKIKIINENLENEEKENDELKKKMIQLKDDLEYANSEAVKNKMEFAEISQIKDEYEIQIRQMKRQIQEFQNQNLNKKIKKGIF